MPQLHTKFQVSLSSGFPLIGPGVKFWRSGYWLFIFFFLNESAKNQR